MRAFTGAALVAAASAADAGTIKLAWSDCGDSSTHGHITSLAPTTVALGTKTSLAGKGSVDEAIKGATYKVDAKALGITVFSHTGDACKPDTIKLPAGAGEIVMKGFNCPMSTGDVELDLDLTLSSNIPASLARVTIDLTATSSSGDKALCVKIKTAPASEDWEDFKQTYQKSYSSSQEESYRKGIFESNVELIAQENTRQSEYQLGVNQFADLLVHESCSDLRQGHHLFLRIPFTFQKTRHAAFLNNSFTLNF
jgi:hypothetical protein